MTVKRWAKSFLISRFGFFSILSRFSYPFFSLSDFVPQPNLKKKVSNRGDTRLMTVSLNPKRSMLFDPIKVKSPFSFYPQFLWSLHAIPNWGCCPLSPSSSLYHCIKQVIDDRPNKGTFLPPITLIYPRFLYRSRHRSKIWISPIVNVMLGWNLERRNCP